MLDLTRQQHMLDDLLEEVRERPDDQFCALLIEELEVHDDDGSVAVVPTTHVDDAALQQLLNFRCELHR